MFINLRSRIVKKAVSIGVAVCLIGGQLSPVVPEAMGGLSKAWAATVITSQQTSTIGPGVSYSKATASMDGIPEQINQVTLDSTSQYIKLRTSAPQDRSIGLETVRSQATRQSGVGEAVIAAVNGDFFYLADPAGMPIGMQIRDGEIISAPGKQLVFGVTTLGVPFITNLTMKGSVTTVSGQAYSHQITVVNKRRLLNDLAVYTPAMGGSTQTNNLGTELVVTGLSLPLKPDQVYTGTVTVKRVGGGNTSIPSDGVVLSGHGLSAQFLNKIQVGANVSFSISFNKPDIAQALGGITKPVTDGQAITAAEAAKLDSGLVRAPRTVVGIRGKEIIITTVDGRQPGVSGGMTLPEIGQFLANQGIQEAINLDGGGSTTCVVRRQFDTNVTLENKPSDGNERKVSNSLQVVNIAPPGEPTYLKIAPASHTIFTGSRMQMYVKALDQYANPCDVAANQVIWSVDAGLGTIDSNGWFTAGHQATEGKVTASVYGGGTTSVSVKVVDSVSGISLGPNPVMLELGRTGKLQVQGWDENNKNVVINNGVISWYASGGIGSVDSTGVFTAVYDAVKEGRITATVGNKSSTVKAYIGRQPVVLDGFESLSPWQSDQLRATGAFNLNSSGAAVKSGFNSGKLAYNFAPNGKAATGTSASYAKYKGKLAIQGKPLRLGVWAYGDNKGHWLRAIYYDGNGTKRYLEFAPKTGVNWSGWKYVTADFPNSVPLPLRLESIYLAEDRTAKKGSGAIYLDDLTAVYRDNASTDQLEISLSLPNGKGGFTPIDVPVKALAGAESGKYLVDLDLSGSNLPKLDWKNLNMYKLLDNGSLKLQPTRYLADSNTLRAVITGLGEYRLKENEVGFSDVTASSAFAWAQDDIEAMASREIVTGTGNNLFAPGAGVTRAQFITMLVRAMDLNVNPTKQVALKDINSSQWYAAPVRIAVSNGIIKGYSDHTFQPNKPITRLEMALTLCRAAKLTKGNFTVNSSALAQYKDRDQVPEWAENDLGLAIQLGLMQGKTENMLYFNDNGNRAEATVLIKRYYDKFGLLDK